MSDQETEEQKFERSKIAKQLLGFLATLLIGVAGKIITMLLASDSATNVVIYLSQNYSFWFSILGASLSGGYFASKWTRDEK